MSETDTTTPRPGSLEALQCDVDALQQYALQRLADWCEENGDALRAAGYRWMATWCKWPVWCPSGFCWEECLARCHPSDWMCFVERFEIAALWDAGGSPRYSDDPQSSFMVRQVAAFDTLHEALHAAALVFGKLKGP